MEILNMAPVLILIVILQNADILIGAVVPPFRNFDFSVVPSDTVVQAGQRAELLCNATYNTASPSVYSWKRNAELLHLWSGQNKLMPSNGSLIFLSVSEGTPSPDPGNYRCVAEVTGDPNVYRIASPEAQLRIAYKGSFEIEPEDLSLRIGDTAMFECRTRGSPAATYTWTRNSRIITGSSRIRIHGEGEVLEISSVDSADAGSYQCKATNSAGVLNSKTSSLSVQQFSDADATPPQFLVRPRSLATKIGTSVTLYCGITGRDPAGLFPTLTWLRQGSYLNVARSGGRFEMFGQGSLRINNVTQSDEGRYTCRGANSLEIADSEVSVSILIPPYFVTRPSNTYGHVNEDAEIKCDIRGKPEPHIYWLKNSDRLEASQYFQFIGGNLRIQGLMQSDSGYFQCIGVNEAGNVYGTAQLIVVNEDVDLSPQILSALAPINASALPTAPRNLTAGLISHTYISLAWTGSQTANTPVSGYTVSTVSLTDQSSETRTRSANTSSTDYTIQGLQPNTDYLFQVSAYNRNGRSEQHKELRVRTLAEAAVPSPVRDLSAVAFNHTSIEVSWSIPIVSNGEILEYRVYYYSEDQSREKNLTSDRMSATITDLQPYTEYHIRTVAYNSNGQGMPADELTVTTYSAKPSSPPTDVTTEVTGTTSILLRWSPPPSNSINGQLSGYKIRYKAKDSFARPYSHTTDADARTYEIPELESGTLYIFRVGAVNINGSGEMSPWVEASTYSAELDESRPPGKPRRLLLEPFSHEMIVSWIPANETILARGYRLGYGTIIPEERWMEIDPDKRFATLLNLKPITNYVVQLISYNRAGSSQAIYQQAFTTQEEAIEIQRPLDPPLEVKAMVISSRSVLVTWYDSGLGDNQINTDGRRVYTVKYNALSGTSHRRTQYSNTTELIMRLDNLRPYTEYEFSVMLTKGAKSSQYSLSIRNTTKEDAPGSPPEDLTIRQSQNREEYLYISWQPPSQPNGRIVSYQIYSNTDRTKPLNRWAQDGIAGHTLNHEFGPVTYSTVYYFTISANTSKGQSPAADIISIKTPGVDGEGGYGFNGDDTPDENIRHSGGDRFDITAGADDSTGGAGVILTAPSDIPVTNVPLLQSPNLLWIIIASVAGVTLIAIVVFLAVLCNRRKHSADKDAPGPQANGTRNGSNKPPPADLWIDHERHELTGLSRPDADHTDNETDEMTSMLQSNFDVSVSMAGDVPPYTGGQVVDDGRYSSVNRGRPVIIATNPHREGMPRAAVPPMSADPARPLYPRTQFAAGGGQYGSTPRVHVGDTSQPSSEYYHHAHSHHNKGGTPHSPHHASMGAVPTSPSHSSRNYSKPPTPTSHVPPHIVKPQPTSAFKVPNQMTSSAYNPTGSPVHQVSGGYNIPTVGVESPGAVRASSLRRPSRQASQSPTSNNMNNLSASREDLKNSMMTQSTEQLSAEMAHLDCIMQDLNAIKTDFEMT